jgi:hypothetical protein
MLLRKYQNQRTLRNFMGCGGIGVEIPVGNLDFILPTITVMALEHILLPLNVI